MEILSLFTNEINQNGYNFNLLTKNKIGFLYIAPVNIVPEDCLACDGYVLRIEDYKKLYSVIGKNLTLVKSPLKNLEFLITTLQKDSYSQEKMLENILKLVCHNIITVEQRLAMVLTHTRFLIQDQIMMMATLVH